MIVGETNGKFYTYWLCDEHKRTILKTIEQDSRRFLITENVTFKNEGNRIPCEDVFCNKPAVTQFTASEITDLTTA